MKRFWLICSLCCVFSFGCASNTPIWKLAEQTAATVEVDSDSNNAVDVTYGGTNATTAAGARTNLGVTATEDMDTEAEFESEFFAILTPGEAEGDIGSVLDDGSGDVPQLYQAPAAFTDTDTTPDVSSQTIYITANTSGTTISDFDAGAGSLKNGQILFIIINDANTTFDFTSSGLEGIGSDYSPGSGEMMLFTYSTTDNQWHCLEVGGGGSGSVENDSYGSGWNSDTTNSPSQNAIYDYLHQYDTDDDGSLIDESWFDLDNLGDITGTGSAGKILYDDGDGTYSFQSPTYETADAAIVKSDEAETLTANWVNTDYPWADDEVADDITAGSCTGNAATVTTNANLTGDVTSTGNATDITESVLGVGGSDTIFPADPGADKYLMWDDDPGNLSWEDAAGGGYTNLTSFIAQTAWRLFYSNTDGDVTEFAFGSVGKVLTSGGASAAPTWETPSSSGSATKQIHVVIPDPDGLISSDFPIYHFDATTFPYGVTLTKIRYTIDPLISGSNYRIMIEEYSGASTTTNMTYQNDCLASEFDFGATNYENTSESFSDASLDAGDDIVVDFNNTDWAAEDLDMLTIDVFFTIDTE